MGLFLPSAGFPFHALGASSQQLTRRCSASRIMGGGSLQQTGMAFGQRGLNRQPDGI
jgi:hypothetical protein